MGLCVSYAQVENGLATGVCKRFKDDGILWHILRSDLYIVGSLDNIDHNLSCTTLQGSFHGTGISVFQFPSENAPSGSKPIIEMSKNESVKDVPLLE